MSLEIGTLQPPYTQQGSTAKVDVFLLDTELFWTSLFWLSEEMSNCWFFWTICNCTSTICSCWWLLALPSYLSISLPTFAFTVGFNLILKLISDMISSLHWPTMFWIYILCLKRVSSFPMSEAFPTVATRETSSLKTGLEMVSHSPSRVQKTGDTLETSLSYSSITEWINLNSRYLWISQDSTSCKLQKSI